MAETSGLWTTGTSGTGHQVASYTQAQASDMLRITAACAGYEGVAPGYLNELSASATGTAVCTIAPGGAMVDGKWYNNSANVDKTIAAAVGGGNTRVDRVVVRAGWATYAATITVIAGTDAATPGTPGLTQNSGTTYDIPLCLCTVDTSGAITITDNRTWALPQTDGTTIVTTGGNLYVPTGGIGTAQIADGAVTATKIANRTRTFFVEALPTSAASFSDIAINAVGVLLEDGVTDDGYCHFFVPSDFVSGMTAVAVVVSEATGNIYCSAYALYGAAGQTIATHSDSYTPTAVALTNQYRTEVASISLSSVAANDYVQIQFIRNAGNASDTINEEVRLLGWKVSYTADS